MSPADPRLAGMTAHLAPGGWVVGEVRRFGSGRAVSRLGDDLAGAGLVIEHLVWMRPGSGPARTIVPAADEAAIRFLMDRGLAAPLVRVRAKNRLPALADLERRLAASPSGNRFSLRIGFVARRQSDAPNTRKLRRPFQLAGTVRERSYQPISALSGTPESGAPHENGTRIS